MSEHLFPGLSNYNSVVDDDTLMLGNEVLTNLPLQMTLYFNSVYFPCWIIVTFFMLPLKFWKLSILYQFILALALLSVILVEAIRLYMGFFGNIKEKIPELAGFWLISLLLQSPLQIFLLFCSALRPSILELIAQSIMCIFILIELLFGFFALHYAAKHSLNSFQAANWNVNSLQYYKAD
ncbi:hypothetical protein AAG570_000600 [Ranatra chinensis]|uniref:Transmembrane protein 17 n=1 Tax=Ranatra chinensis TaxID=642074 RepID=A0ABD0YXH9_9HEMI